MNKNNFLQQHSADGEKLSGDERQVHWRHSAESRRCNINEGEDKLWVNF